MSSSFKLRESLVATAPAFMVKMILDVMPWIESILASWRPTNPGLRFEVSISKLSVNVVATLERHRPPHFPDNWPQRLAVQEKQHITKNFVVERQTCEGEG